MLRTESETNLPGPKGPLSKVIPSSTIAKVNEKVSSVIEKLEATNRGPYLHVTAAQRYQVGRRAIKFGVTSILWCYMLEIFPVFISLKETSSIRWFKTCISVV